MARSVIVLVSMVMVVAAAASRAMIMILVLMVVGVLVLPMVVPMSMVMMIMAVMVMLMTMVVIVGAHMGAAFRLEGTLNGRHRAALAAGKFREGWIVLDVERIVRDLGEAVIAAEMPGEAHEAERVFRLHFQKPLWLRRHLHQTAVFQAQRIAVVDGGFHVEVENDLGSRIALERRLAAIAGLVVEHHRIDDTVGLYGGLADDGGDAGHGLVSLKIEWLKDRKRGRGFNS